MTIIVSTSFRGKFRVKDPKKIEYYKKLAEKNPGMIIKEVHDDETSL